MKTKTKPDPIPVSAAIAVRDRPDNRGSPGTDLVPTFPVRRRLLSTLTVAGMSGGVGASRVGYEMAVTFINLGGRLIDVEVLDCSCGRDDLLAVATGGAVVLVGRAGQIGEAAELVTARPAAVAAVVLNQLTPERLSRSEQLQVRALRGRVEVVVLPHVRNLAARTAPRAYGSQIRALCKQLQQAQTIVADTTSAAQHKEQAT